MYAGHSTVTNEEGRRTEVRTPLQHQTGVSLSSAACAEDTTRRRISATPTSAPTSTRVTRQRIESIPGAFVYRVPSRRGEHVTYVLVRDGVAGEYCEGGATIRLSYEATADDADAERHHIFRFAHTTPLGPLPQSIRADYLVESCGARGLAGLFERMRVLMCGVVVCSAEARVACR